MDLLSLASGTDATFYFCRGGEHPVLYHVYKGHDQLVLPSRGGFHDIFLRELYDTALGIHLGSSKTLKAYYRHVSGGHTCVLMSRPMWQPDPRAKGSKTAPQLSQDCY